MQVQVDKKQENTSQLSAETRKQTGGEFAFQFADNRPEAGMHRTVQAAADQSAQSRKTAQLQVMADNFPSQVAIQQQKNDTGLPDKLKSGIEHLSGYSLNDVKVHYNSAKPAQLQAHAYAQGTDIHIASGQEKHLAHEAWHVVQQKQGRVQPTVQLKGNVNVNDDAGLENEADVMGAKALQTLQMKSVASVSSSSPDTKATPVVQLVRYNNPSELRNEMNKAEEFSDLSKAQIESLSKEFPVWFLGTYKTSYREIDFENAKLREEINKMISATDEFTDLEGQALTTRINETDEDKLLIGYRAMGENRPDKKAAMPFGDGTQIGTQIGNGLYVAKKHEVAMEYAQQYVTQGMIGVIQEVYLNVRMIKDTIKLKGISVKEWWKQYDKTNDDTWDVLVASISGKVGAIQYKVNPKHKESGLLELRDIQRVVE